ncbi:ATP synthase gamma chain, chloroplastic [Vitis vinifera]|uniref:F-ATPase gamma subunit n=1 Tax=Vitis vinifera TaxID=29760 RepID=A0A438ISA8_VITVI|nr:ATP synthase gamma chain, chloroplastic [Vitis vinifera]
MAESRIAELTDLGLDCTVISVDERVIRIFVAGVVLRWFRWIVLLKEEVTTKEGKLSVERDKVQSEKVEFSPFLEFEQDPAQILDALMPLYLNSQILRALQESLASELAARMCAMSNATDNAVELTKTLSLAYNRKRQAKITGEILEIVAGADALSEQP